ncbi:HTH domain-containing protein [Bernardetia sp. OM2101]|uniref:HTH domain-containing protein n=1 Tax=Bernardetia sp. OM2101 TaxID=3344876 RepID=UPI0035D0BFC6
MTFLELAEKVLQETQTPMKANDIWTFGVEKGYDKILGSLGKTPSATLGARLYTYVRDNPQSNMSSTDARPKKFFLKSFDNVEKRVEEAEQQEIKEIEKETKQLKKLEKVTYLEKELHAVLAYYAFYYLRTYTKTINHSASTKKRIWRMDTP